MTRRAMGGQFQGPYVAHGGDGFTHSKHSAEHHLHKARGGLVKGKRESVAREGKGEPELHLKGGSGIHIKASHKGLLHKNLGVPAGKPIPAAKLAKAKNSSDPAVRKRATFAQNAKHWHHG